MLGGVLIGMLRLADGRIRSVLWLPSNSCDLFRFVFSFFSFLVLVLVLGLSIFLFSLFLLLLSRFLYCIVSLPFLYFTPSKFTRLTPSIPMPSSSKLIPRTRIA